MASKRTPSIRSLSNIFYTILLATVLTHLSHCVNAAPSQPPAVENLDLIFFAEIPLNCSGAQISCPTQLQCSTRTVPYIRCPRSPPGTCCAVFPPFCGAMGCDRGQGCGIGVELALYTGIRDCSIHGTGFGHYYCRQLESVDEKGDCCMLGFGSNGWEVDPDGVRGGCSAEWWYHSHQEEKRHDNLYQRSTNSCVEASVLTFYDDGGLQREVHIPKGMIGRAGTLVLEQDWNGLLKEFNPLGKSYGHSFIF